MSDGIPLAGPREWIKLIFRRAYGVRVEGDSMIPLLQSGDRVLIDPKASVKPGDVVLARHPYKSSVRVLKRLNSIESDGRIFLLGDNPDDSIDSRTFGSISRTDVLGKAVARFK